MNFRTKAWMMECVQHQPAWAMVGVMVLSGGDVAHQVRNSRFPFEGGNRNPQVRHGNSYVCNAVQLHSHLSELGGSEKTDTDVSMKKDAFVCAFLERQLGGGVAHLRAMQGSGEGEANAPLVPFGLAQVLTWTEDWTRGAVDSHGAHSGSSAEDTCAMLSTTYTELVEKYLRRPQAETRPGNSAAGPFLNGAASPALEDVLLFDNVLEASLLRNDAVWPTTDANKAALTAHFDAVLGAVMTAGAGTAALRVCLENLYTLRHLAKHQQTAAAAGDGDDTTTFPFLSRLEQRVQAAAAAAGTGSGAGTAVVVPERDERVGAAGSPLPNIKEDKRAVAFLATVAMSFAVFAIVAARTS